MRGAAVKHLQTSGVKYIADEQAKSLGPRSRAGLIAYPALAPKEIPIAATARPITSGPIFANGALFRRSMIATTISTRNIVPTIWSISGPHILPWKYGEGKVAKMENVASV